VWKERGRFCKFRLFALGCIKGPKKIKMRKGGGQGKRKKVIKTVNLFKKKCRFDNGQRGKKDIGLPQFSPASDTWRKKTARANDQWKENYRLEGEACVGLMDN